MACVYLLPGARTYSSRVFAEDPIMNGFASRGYSDYPNRIGFETACENPNKKNGFEFEINFQGIEKYKIRTNHRLRCEMRV